MKSFSSILLIGLLSCACLHAPAPLAAAPMAASAGKDVTQAIELARVGDMAPMRRLLDGKALPSAIRQLFQARLSASELNDTAASAALSKYFASGDAEPARIREAHEIAALAAFAAGRYGDAARHGAQVVAQPVGLQSSQVDGIRRLTEIAGTLASSPRQQLERRGKGSASIFRDKVGLIRTSIISGQAREEAILDTGANLSVASASAARRMGLKMLGGASSVGNSVGTHAEVRIGIADRLSLAGATIRNVVFLVMDDKVLEFPVAGGYRIDTIIGFPVMRALGRLSFGQGDVLRVGGERPLNAQASPLRMVGNMPYIVATIGNAEHPLVFDSGANHSVLHSRFASARPELKIENSGKKDRTAGVGGAKEVRIAHYPKLNAVIGGESVELKDVPVEVKPKSEPDEDFGVIGNDILNLFDVFTVDFERMTFEAVKK